MQKKQPREKNRIKRRRLPPEERRIELLNAAVNVLNAMGPENARVQDITKAAGAAKGTFYLYFSSWEKMLEAVREHILLQYVTDIKNRFVCRTPKEWWVSFENEFMQFIGFREELGQLHDAIFHGAIAKRPMHPDLSSGTIIGWMLNKGIKLGACRDVDVDVAAQLIFSVMHTMADNIMVTQERERYIQTTLELLRFWLCTTEPA